MEAEKNQTAQISQKAKTIKIAITIFGFLIFAVAVQLVWDGAAEFGK